MLSSFSALSGRGRGAARLAAATLVSGLVAAGVLVAGAGQAAADGTAQNQGGATATIGGLKTYGAAVIHGEAGDQEVSAGLFEMSVEGGGTLQTYCVDLYNPTQKDAKYRETPWSGTSLGVNENAGKIRWILQNSYPQVNDLAALAEKAGLQGGLTEQDAAAGTQVAVWRYSDDADVDAVDPQAEKLADYLEESARDVAEPAPSLTLDPPALSGRPGERLGPVTVHTGASAVTVKPPADAATSGLRIVDKAGKPVTSTSDGGQIYVDVPEEAAAGTAELTVQASTTVPVGRAFTSESRSQTQILAGSSESTVSATARATWAKKGAIPALSAAKNCAKGGVDIMAANEGDESFSFELLGAEYTIGAGESRTVTIPLQEDQAYDFTIEGPGGFAQRFTGVLDCMTQAAEADNTSTQTLTEPSPATVGGTSPDTNLAATGSSDATPVIAGVAIGLVLIGGASLLIVRRKKTPERD
ncbi:Cys-Gln thioester bond-forming surface protein [Streptomyces sp. P17]|uniref:Cys-Gln thioester bond-forming surface protein n=1 Tax=Streptomyces sp. P17 TaxID=3074716 RepID=UPI0028F458AF|nr:Cys-Gln thioester bond-forming surface protein [Streptomyces sp. P17]MDT9700191.1 Cys-Gln thioester bond-forming surface protein [Streptomyces sp. P17]